MSNRAPRLLRSTRRFAVATIIATIGVTPAAALIGSSGASAAPPAVAALKTGAQGSEVQRVQQALVDRGFLSAGDVDGIYGAKTTAAVRRFQASQGLLVDGVVGEVTSIALGLTSSSYFGLKSGDTGDNVTALQNALKGAGFDPGAADGVFGSATKYAVSAFQRSLAYLQTGEMNAATAAALEARSGSSSGSTTGSTSGSSTGSSSGTDNSASFDAMRLSIGSRGNDVSKVQSLLISLKYDVVGGADGIYGGMTANAVRAFQRDNGLYIDAIVGPNTAGALQRASQGGAATPTEASGSILGLKTGSTGAAVKTLQSRLLEIGVPLNSKIDGIYGPATAASVRLFQSWNGLEKTGAIGPETKAALDGAKKADVDDSKPSGDIGYAVYGENSTRVTALQNKLVSAGINVPGGVDGIFGSGTSSAVMSFQRTKGLNVTGVVSKATATTLGLETMDRPAAPTTSSTGGGYIKVFPVQGWCGYSNTWGAYRSGGRSHIGTDIIAANGKELYAIDDGVIEKLYSEASDRLSGNGVRLRLADGTYAFYAHMSQLGPGIGVGTRVSAGQVVGYVGSTGNAYTPHLHFEIHPKGGAAINPYPYLKATDACQVTKPR